LQRDDEGCNHHYQVDGYITQEYAMQADLFWRALAWPGLEHLHLNEIAGTTTADGALIAQVDGSPVRLRYRLSCDPGWRTRRVEVELSCDAQVAQLESDGRGSWRDPGGERQPALEGCLDVDIALTPFTNTLPIRRLRLGAGERRELRVVYFAPPTFKPTVVTQRYTCLEHGPDGSTYRYQSAEFSADLSVDRDGLVVTYPGLWERAR
jgi:hypothetical protein